MSTFVDLLPQIIDDAPEAGGIEVEREEYQQPGLAGWNADSFAEQHP